MKYFLLGDDYKLLFVEDNDGFSIFYSPKIGLWYPGGTTLNDARVGFDPSEPEDSPYRYGNTSCMQTIGQITHEQAEVFFEWKVHRKANDQINETNQECDKAKDAWLVI